MTIRSWMFPQPAVPPTPKKPRRRRSPNDHTPDDRTTSRREWTPEDDAFLRKHYPRRGGAFCAEQLDRPKSSVNHRAERLGVRYRLRRDWTAKEDATLRLQYRKSTAPQLARRLKRTESSIRQRLLKLGLTVPVSRPWDNEDLAYLWAHYRTHSTAEIAAELGRTVEAVELKAGRIGLRRRKANLTITAKQERMIVQRLGTAPYTVIGRELGLPTDAVVRIARKHNHRTRATPRAWSPEEDAVLRSLFPTMTNEQIGERLGRTPIAVVVRARALRLLRPANWGHSGPRKLWTKEEEQQLARLCRQMPHKQVAKLLGRTESSVAVRAQTLGILRRPRKQ